MSTDEPTIGIYEAARILAVTPTRADQLSRQKSFPAPATTDAVRRRKWRRVDIEAYAANRKEQPT